MARITEITTENADDAQREILEAQEAEGGVFNTSRIWAQRVGAFQGLMGFASALEADSTCLRDSFTSCAFVSPRSTAAHSEWI